MKKAKSIIENRRYYERNTYPHRIERQQRHPFRYAARSGSERERRTEKRARTRSDAHRERQPEQKRRPYAVNFARLFHSLEKRKIEKPDVRQPEQDNDRARNYIDVVNTEISSNFDR